MFILSISSTFIYLYHFSLEFVFVLSINSSSRSFVVQMWSSFHHVFFLLGVDVNARQPSLCTKDFSKLENIMRKRERQGGDYYLMYCTSETLCNAIVRAINLFRDV